MLESESVRAVFAEFKQRLASPLVGLMRYVLLRPQLKKAVLRVLAVHPQSLMAIKRFGVRVGLAADMGPRLEVSSGRNAPMAGYRPLSSRAARILEDLQRAMADRTK
ncbi:hypothetical protein [Xanthomonas bonasiae]|uniref:hypothetical protein n=1 Tax=Xanthomonas bonasiae TaxID=2810351 RepID=UPI0019819904|nr:hypothetical protein [Xanthomonas bonasiae]MBN6109988.1 hypothetical protein [Xanthomonas bonasiae]